MKQTGSHDSPAPDDHLRAGSFSIDGDLVPDYELFSPKELIHDLMSSPKRIGSIYCYDDRGSRLFEELCAEPTYYLTRTEQQILCEAATPIADVIGRAMVVELGCGNAEKTIEVLKALSRARNAVTYVPIDINRYILQKATETVANAVAHVSVKGIVGTFETALAKAALLPGPKCIVFLGSTIGNLTDIQIGNLMKVISSSTAVGDYLLLGLDLDKSSEVVEAAYNNQTAMLTNFASLAHVNWRFGGDLDIFRFRHVAFHNVAERQIEIHAESVANQRITLAQLNWSFDIGKGERILTEISRKFVLKEFQELMKEHGYNSVRQFHDTKQYYSVGLFQRNA